MKKQYLKKEAIKLRRQGFSLREISIKLGISKSTASVWLNTTQISIKGKKRLDGLVIEGRRKALLKNNFNKEQVLKKINLKNKKTLKSVNFNKEFYKFSCAMLYWCEGGKTDNSLIFYNSDPEMIKTYLYFLRKGFKIDESKFRVCLHLHSYHNEKKQKIFWSNITNIPQNKFIKTYKKENTGKRKKEGYPGCASIRYHDSLIKKEVQGLWEMVGKKYAGVV